MAWTAPRTWVAGAVLTAAQLNVDVRDNMGVLSRALLSPEHLTGLYYRPLGVYQSANVVVSANVLYAAPVPIPASGSYDRVAVTCITASGASARLGLYADNAGVPGALLEDGGAAALADATLLAQTIAETIVGPTIVWLAAVFNGTPTMGAIEGIGIGARGTSTSGSLATVIGVSRTFTYGALPDPYGSPTGGSVISPFIAMRKV